MKNTGLKRILYSAAVRIFALTRRRTRGTRPRIQCTVNGNILSYLRRSNLSSHENLIDTAIPGQSRVQPSIIPRSDLGYCGGDADRNNLG